MAGVSYIAMISGILLISSSLVFAKSDVIPTECPKSDKINETVHLAHETDCTKFYSCSHGVKHLKECPVIDAEGNRLHFNPVLQACDWPEDAGCVLDSRLSRKIPVTPKVEIPTECPKVDPVNHTIQLAHESDCTKFYKCSRGEKFELSCPVYDEEGHKLYFNPELQLCDWPANVDCKLPEPAKPKSGPLTREIPTKCPAVNPIGYTIQLAHESDCTKFYMCSHGIKWEMDCPDMNTQGDKLHFNPQLQTCDWPSTANCQNFAVVGLKPEPRVGGVPVPQVDQSCPLVDPVNYTVQLPHETDCTKFYKCTHGMKYEMSCPKGNADGYELHYNAALQVCDWPENAKCELHA